MIIPDIFRQRVSVFLFTGIFFLGTSHYEASAAVPKALDRSKAIVSIESVNAVGCSVDGKGNLGGNVAALFLHKNVARPMKYLRSGGGVIIDPRGIIVTNAHIIQNAAGISVKLFNGVRLEGKVLRVIPGMDMAFLSIRAPFSLSFVPLANSDELVSGARVYCIGHTLNHTGSLFGGEVSGILKQPAFRGPRPVFLQVRFGFHLYSGDSGSPILNQKGALLGLVSGGRRNGDMAALAVASNVIRDAYWAIPK